MKKRSRARKKVASKTGRDKQVAEFDRRDLGADIRNAGTARVLRPRTRPTSIVLDADLVEKLRAKGAKRGLGYQTMLKMIVREHLDEYRLRGLDVCAITADTAPRESPRED